MPPDSKPPPLPPVPQPRNGAPPPLAAVAPAAPQTPQRHSSSLSHPLAVLLSLCLGLFLADGLVSLADDSLKLLFGLNILALPRAIVGLPALLLAVLIYLLMGVTPRIPKRQFLPLTLFYLAAQLAALPALTYFYGHLQKLAWAASFCQVILGFGLLGWIQGGFKLRWMLVAENQLEGRGFSWRNLLGFLAVNLFGLLPAVVAYFCFCAALAVNHFSEGFVSLRPAGMTVQVRTYVRNDGKTIRLVPMSHVGEPEFYRTLAESFPTNSLILMEGVTDDQGLLTNKLSYQRMAKALGVTEQHVEFRPQAEMVSADVDISVFTKSTLGFLNLVMRLHSKGVDLPTVLQLMQASTPQNEAQLFEDLLGKRNEHLLGEIRTRLKDADYLIVPWGAAHMPEVARGVLKSGFRLQESQEYVAIRFRSVAKKSKPPGKAEDSGKPQ